MSENKTGLGKDIKSEELPKSTCIEGQVPFPRRSCIDKMIPAERAIYHTEYEVEMLGRDERLTNAVIKLHEARELVADYVDSLAPTCSAINY